MENRDEGDLRVVGLGQNGAAYRFYWILYLRRLCRPAANRSRHRPAAAADYE